MAKPNYQFEKRQKELEKKKKKEAKLQQKQQNKDELQPGEPLPPDSGEVPTPGPDEAAAS